MSQTCKALWVHNLGNWLSPCGHGPVSLGHARADVIEHGIGALCDLLGKTRRFGCRRCRRRCRCRCQSRHHGARMRRGARAVRAWAGVAVLVAAPAATVMVGAFGRYEKIAWLVATEGLCFNIHLLRLFCPVPGLPFLPVPSIHIHVEKKRPNPISYHHSHHYSCPSLMPNIITRPSP